MNEELLAENIARELARVYCIAWKEAFISSILSADDWSDANWNSFCEEAWKIIDKTKLCKTH